MKIFSVKLLLIPLLLIGCGITETDNGNNKEKLKVALFSKKQVKESGISFINTIKETENYNYLLYPGFYQGGGIAIGDLNNDGLLDLYFSGNQVGDELYVNRGELKFENKTASAGIINDTSWSSGVSMVDVNADGLTDIYVCKYLLEDSDLRANKLYVNKGNLQFEESSKSFGLADTGHTVEALWVDYDLDGDLDVYLVNQPPNEMEQINRLVGKKDFRYTDRLYRNEGNNTFLDVTQNAGITNYGYGLSASIIDINKDGYPDIYVSNDYEEPDNFYLNKGDGTFQNIADYVIKHMSNFSMGTDVGDINNDGLQDIVAVDMVAKDNYRIKANMSGMNPEKFWGLANAGYHYQYMSNVLQLNNGNGTFSDIAPMAGVANTDWSWSPLLVDFDNDGYRDLFVTNGMKRDVRNSDFAKTMKQTVQGAKKTGKPISLVELINKAPVNPILDGLFQNNGDLTFSDVAKSWGIFEPGMSNGAAYGDLDNDGDIDLVINAMEDTSYIYENTLNGSENNYVRFHLTGSKNNPNAFGAEVEIVYGNNIQVGVVHPTRGFQSNSELDLHFGLGRITNIDSVFVRWPNGKEQLLLNQAVNQTIECEIKNAALKSDPFSRFTKHKTLLGFTGNQHGVDFEHSENEYNDYKSEVLLPHKMSQLGPTIAFGDINDDGLADFFIGGAKNKKSAIYIQTANGFKLATSVDIEADKKYEDVVSEFVDIDSDGDLDLIVGSGSNEWETGSEMYRDRAYLNNGKGQFSLNKPLLPNYNISTGCIISFDYDNDGDLDLFVGSRQKPQHYPDYEPSLLLNNINGKYEIAEKLNLGMVTDASWNKKLQQLIVVGEWMPITILDFSSGIIAQSSIENSTGWWNKMEPQDLDNDGDLDFVIGNLGLNIKYKASIDEPFSVYYNDFDSNGKNDIVLSYYSQGNCFPVRGRQCSSEQVPELKEKFPTYDLFASSSLQQIYGDRLDSSLQYHATMFESVWMENTKDGYKLHKLPNEAQVFPVNGIVIEDFDNDGYSDLLLAGNNYHREVETTRSDAGVGLYLKGNKDKTFTPVPLWKSGFYADKDVRDIEKIGNYIIVANNNNKVQMFKIGW